jgi:hypothetical protein
MFIHRFPAVQITMGAQSTSTKEETDTRDSHNTEKERSIGVGVAGQVAGGSVGVHASHGNSKKVSRTLVSEHSLFFCVLRLRFHLNLAISEALYSINETKEGSEDRMREAVVLAYPGSIH